MTYDKYYKQILIKKYCTTNRSRSSSHYLLIKIMNLYDYLLKLGFKQKYNALKYNTLKVNLPYIQFRCSVHLKINFFFRGLNTQILQIDFFTNIFPYFFFLFSFKKKELFTFFNCIVEFIIKPKIEILQRSQIHNTDNKNKNGNWKLPNFKNIKN